MGWPWVAGPHRQGAWARQSSSILVEDSRDLLSCFTVTATGFVSIPDPVLLCSWGRKGNLPLFPLHFPRVPITKILGTAPSTPLQAVPVPLAAIPYSLLPWAPGVLWTAALAACLVPFWQVICLPFPLSCTVHLYLPLFFYSASPSPSLQVLFVPLPHCALMAPGHGLDPSCLLGLSPGMFMFSQHCPKW